MIPQCLHELNREQNHKLSRIDSKLERIGPNLELSYELQFFMLFIGLYKEEKSFVLKEYE